MPPFCFTRSPVWAFSHRAGIVRQKQRVLFGRSFSSAFPTVPYFPPLYDVHPDVLAALQKKKAVVALESTIISHGMPYPENYQTAIAVEDIVREEGCVPATIAILDGRVKVGLSGDDLEKLAKTGLKARKTSRRDLALVTSQGLVGATTVSATMLIAHQAGIKVFVTGGIGGVHRGGEQSMDISADLTDLGRTPVAVVCAGAKSILDIEKTLEYLETQGVTVVTYGDSDEFPAFYTRSSGFKSIANLGTPDACARLIHANSDLKLQSGMVIAVPIPAEDAPKEAGKIEEAVKEAVVAAQHNGIRGKDITPFLLDRVKSITKGESLKSNIALVKNNARIGSRIAASLAACGPPPSTSGPASNKSARRPVIVGGTVLDISSHFTRSGEATANGSDIMPVFGTSHPGTCTQSLGGVGRNIAEACYRTGGNPIFLSVVGGDVAGDGLLQEMAADGMDISGVKQINGHPTAIYNAFLKHDGDLLAAVADMRIHEEIDSDEVVREIKYNRPPLVCIDGNLSLECIKRILETCTADNIPVIFEPTSIIKGYNLFNLPIELLRDSSLRYITPNHGELIAMAYACERSTKGLKLDKVPPADTPTIQVESLLQVIPNVIEKKGPEGAKIYQRGINTCTHIRPEKVLSECVSVTGAGDSLVGTLATGLASHYSFTNRDPTLEEVKKFVRAGMRAAEASLLTDKAVSRNIGQWVFS